MGSQTQKMLEDGLLIAVALPSVGSALLCPRLAALPAPITIHDATIHDSRFTFPIRGLWSPKKIITFNNF